MVTFAYMKNRFLLEVPKRVFLGYAFMFVEVFNFLKIESHNWACYLYIGQPNASFTNTDETKYIYYNKVPGGSDPSGITAHAWAHIKLSIMHQQVKNIIYRRQTHNSYIYFITFFYRAYIYWYN